ncbi:hypothetical protein JKP75_04885 [Blastococcus sp. TML/M2B]|uniref:hypothetical protein n=1 Tax=unclassified Blastococcus TaxID=2619396 RepID=UPI00190DC3A5|nr:MULTISPECIES: hypothetical protein [unclassified Blastococcus]MBN1091968.1 hypothetical protein [Blastococcus sp. TML/M2B]MBN1097927.1 hypothetical protein [Blastococcus sp. TML/C7B]
MKASDLEREQILDYFAAQMAEDPVVHLEKVAVERVGSVLHHIWDVHCKGSRWWAISNSLNYYSQDDFKSRDVALTFHVGLMVRIASREEVPITEEAAGLLPRAWRLWEQAIESLDSGREAEDFQALGVRLREVMITYADEVADDALGPEGEVGPKAADVVGWTNLLIAHLAAGPSSKQLRSYAIKLTRETWDYVNWLTHAKNAIAYDAHIGVAAVSHFLSTMTAVCLRAGTGARSRCESCGSYRMVTGACMRCGWHDPNYVAPASRQLTEEELAVRLAKPCVPSSDISTFMSPDDYR